MKNTQTLVCENDNCRHVHSFDERDEKRNPEGWNDLLCPKCGHDVYYETKLSETQMILFDKMVEISSKPIPADAIGRHKWINSRRLNEETGIKKRIINYNLNKLVEDGLLLKRHNAGEYNQFSLKSLKGFVIHGNTINALPVNNLVKKEGQQ